MLAALLDHNVIQQMQVSHGNLGLGKQSLRSSGYGGFVGYNWQWTMSSLDLKQAICTVRSGARLSVKRAREAAPH